MTNSEKRKYIVDIVNWIKADEFYLKKGDIIVTILDTPMWKIDKDNCVYCIDCNLNGNWEFKFKLNKTKRESINRLVIHRSLKR